MLSPAKKTITF